MIKIRPQRGVVCTLVDQDSQMWITILYAHRTGSIQKVGTKITYMNLPNSWSDLDKHEDLFEKGELNRAGFCTSATGFGLCATVRFFKNEPIVAFHWDGLRLEGFSIQEKFRRKGIATALLREWLEFDGFIIGVDANESIMKIFKRIGNVSEPDGASIFKVTPFENQKPPSQ